MPQKFEKIDRPRQINSRPASWRSPPANGNDASISERPPESPLRRCKPARRECETAAVCAPKKWSKRRSREAAPVPASEKFAARIPGTKTPWQFQRGGTAMPLSACFVAASRCKTRLLFAPRRSEMKQILRPATPGSNHASARTTGSMIRTSRGRPECSPAF